MGQDIHRQESLIANGNWKLIREIEQLPFHQINPFSSRTFCNQFTNQYVEEYELQFISEQDYLTYTRQIQARKQTSPCLLENIEINERQTRCSPYIYKVKYFISTNHEDLCSTSYKGLLYVQKVDLRLQEINEIPFSDQLYLLKATLEGFKILYERVGYFDISEEMIFISSRGKVRVWLNPNLSSNQPYYHPRNHQSSQTQQLHGSQSEMIVHLINIIEQNTLLEDSNSIAFKQFLLSKGIFDRLSFYKAIEEFQFYCRENRLFVGNYMRSVFELYQDDVHLHDSEMERSEVILVDTYKNINTNETYEVKSTAKAHQRNYSTELLRVSVTPHLFNSNASYKSKQTGRSSKFAKPKDNKSCVTLKQSSCSGSFKSNEGHLPNPHLPFNKNSNFSHTLPYYIQKPVTFKNIAAESIPDYLELQKEFTFNDNLLSRTNNSHYHRALALGARKNNQQAKYPYERSSPAVTFNYSDPQKEASQVNTANITLLNTFNTINSQSTFSLKETELQFEMKLKESTNQISFYTPDHSFILDNEIAEDLKKYLGFNADSL